jgi:hypothetical protein
VHHSMSLGHLYTVIGPVSTRLASSPLLTQPPVILTKVHCRERLLVFWISCAALILLTKNVRKLVPFSSSDRNLRRPKQMGAVEMARHSHRPGAHNTFKPIPKLLICWNNRTSLYYD